MNISILIFSIAFGNAINIANVEAKSLEASEYTVSQVFSTRNIFLIEMGHQNYVCKSLTPCFGLYKGERVLFTVNPESYHGNKISYMNDSECRISYCERVF